MPAAGLATAAAAAAGATAAGVAAAAAAGGASPVSWEEPSMLLPLQVLLLPAG